MTEKSKAGRLSAFKSFSILQLDRRTALKIAIFSMIIVLAVIFRVMKVRWGPYMDAFDPLFQLRVTEYIVENGYDAWFSWHDTMSWWPMGRNIPHSSFPGTPFTGAFLYQLVNAFGLKVTVQTIALYFPVLMGVLTCIVAYFLGKDIGGSSMGLLSAFFLAISEAFISRTALGFYDTENIGLFGMTLTVLFFLRSIDSSKSRRELVFYSILAGASLSYILASWGAARYVVGLLSLYIISTLVTQHYDRRHLISYTVMMFVGYSVAVFIPRLGFKYLYSMENMLVLMLILLLIVYDFAKDRLEIQNTTLLLVGLILILIIGIFALEAIGIINPISGKFLRVINPGATAENPLSESVAEHRRAAWTSFFRSFGVTLPLAVLGGYLFIRELNSRNLFLTLFLATAFYFAGSMSRLSLILSIPTALMASYGLIKIVEPFIQLSRSREVVRERGRRRRRIPLGISRELAIVFVLFVIVSIFPSVWSTADASLRPTSLASSGISAIIGGNYPQDWLQALVFMKDNLPDDAVVVSWWDYGYWIEAIADRVTMADGATINKTHIGYIGRIMMLNHTESLPMLEAYGGTHVVVFNTFNPGDQTQAWPFGDNVKWSWMVQIGGLNISDYINQDNPSNDLGQTEKGRASVLYGLMNLQPTPGFELIFVSDFRFVLVYEIRYGEI